MLGLLVAGAIGDHRERADVVPIRVPDRAGLEQRPELRGVALPRELDLALLPRTSARALDPPRHARFVGRGKDLEHGCSEQLAWLISEHLREDVVREGDPKVRVDDPDSLVRGLHDAAIPLLALAERVLRLGEQQRRLARSVDDRVDLPREQRLDRGLRLRQEAR